MLCVRATSGAAPRPMRRIVAWLLAFVVLASGALAAAHAVAHPRCDSAPMRAADEGCADLAGCALCLAHVQFDSAAPVVNIPAAVVRTWLPPEVARLACLSCAPAPRPRARAPPALS